MQYTGKGNKFLWYVVLPLLLFLFLVFRGLDSMIFSTKNQVAVNKSHMNNISLSQNLDCLVLGGSNAVFSLSAELLGKGIGAKCYNLSILGEGSSYKNYWNLVDNSLSNNQKEKVKTIVYSSIDPLREGRIEKKKLVTYGINGDKSFKLLGRSLASYFYSWLTKGSFKVNYPLPNKFGDFNFDLYECIPSPTLMNEFEREGNYNVLNEWIIQQIFSIRYVFPNAKIYFSIPSEFYGMSFNQSLFEESALVYENSIESYKDTNQDNKVYLIIEKPFSKESLMCDSGHHANHSGRTDRTSRLVKEINIK